MAISIGGVSLLLGRRFLSLIGRPVSTGVTFRDTEEERVSQRKERDPLKDRTKFIPVETSIKYLESEAYQQTYGSDPVWKRYRRNHKYAFAPRKTRKTCIRNGQISTGNPCPVCRDEYLVLNYLNVNLLKQFISPYTGEILSYSKTGVCRKKQEKLIVSIEKAKDYGYLTFDVPFREYDYSDYYKPETS